MIDILISIFIIGLLLYIAILFRSIIFTLDIMTRAIREIHLPLVEKPKRKK